MMEDKTSIKQPIQAPDAMQSKSLVRVTSIPGVGRHPESVELPAFGMVLPWAVVGVVCPGANLRSVLVLLTRSIGVGVGVDSLR